jgi:hypothetical protein
VVGGKARAADPRQVLGYLRDGSASLGDVFEAAETDDALADLPVLDAIDAAVAGRLAQALWLAQTMRDLVEDLRLHPMASVRDLGDDQRENLMRKLKVARWLPFDEFPFADHHALLGFRDMTSARAGSAGVDVAAATTSARLDQHGVTYQQLAAKAADVHQQLVEALRAGAPKGSVFVIHGGQSEGKSSALYRQTAAGDDGDVQADVSWGVAGGIEIKIFGGVVELKKTGAAAAAGEPNRRDLVDAVAVLAETQLRLLAELDSAAAEADHPRVRLESPTGSVDYQMPIGVEETYSPGQVGELLSPSGKGHRSLAQNRRQSNKLLAIQIDGQQYRYPKFQIDKAHREIRPVVAYANQLLEASQDPWGVLDWWYSEDEGLDDRRPVDMLESGELTEKLVDRAVGLSRQAMD